MALNNKSSYLRMLALAVIVSIVNNQPRAMSTDVAEFFGKEHFNILRDIREIKANCPESFDALNFESVEYVDAKGEKRPAYSMTRDGFTLLAMGFTGEKALQFKLAYIEAFNKMEAALEQQATAQPASRLSTDAALNARSHAITLRIMARMNDVYAQP